MFSLFCNPFYSQSVLYVNGSNFILSDTGAVLYVKGNLKTEDSAQFRNLGRMKVAGDLQHASQSAFFYQDTGTLSLIGTDSQRLDGEFRFFDFEFDNTAGVEVHSGSVVIANTLIPTNGLFVSNDSVTIESTANRTASVAASTGGSTSGDFIVERYLGAGGNAWRMISAPVESATINEWEDDFITSGYTGSQFPSFSFTSIVFYDETQIGDFENGYANADNVTNSISPGKGAWAYIGPLPNTFDAQGPLVFGDVDFQVTHTVGGVSSSDDGWHLLGNPYASAIDWEASGWTKININNAIYIWDGEANQFQSYVNGVGTNGGSPLIPSSQSFFIQTNAVSPSLICSEQVKTSQQADFVYKPMAQHYVKLRLSSAFYQDETVVRFASDATDQFDENYDAIDAVRKSTYAPNISTEVNGLKYSINTQPLSPSVVVPLRLQVNWPGYYTFSIAEVAGISNAHCYQIEDTVNQTTFAVDTSFNVQLYLDTGLVYRNYVLSVQQAFEIEAISPLCAKSNDGRIAVEVFLPGHYMLLLSKGDSILKDDLVSSSFEFDSLASGRYAISIDHPSCSNLNADVELIAPVPVNVNAFVQPDTGNRSGSIDLGISGGKAPYFSFWYHPVHVVGSSIFNLSAGTYAYLVQDQNLCDYYGSINVPLIDESLATSKLKQTAITLFPSPASRQLCVSGLESTCAYSIYSMDGCLLNNGEVEPEKCIDIGSFNSGVYVLKLGDKQLPLTFIKN